MTLGTTDLYREELAYERQKHHLFTVPNLLGIDFYSASEFPPLPTVLHKDLDTHIHGHVTITFGDIGWTTFISWRINLNITTNCLTTELLEVRSAKF